MGRIADADGGLEEVLVRNVPQDFIPRGVPARCNEPNGLLNDAGIRVGYGSEAHHAHAERTNFER